MILLDYMLQAHVRIAFVFVIFFSVTSLAFLFYHRRYVRSLYLAFFLVCLLAVGLSGKTMWPLFSWNLYGYRSDTYREHYEMIIVDQNGNEIKYDARAVRPSLATPIRRFAEAMLTFTTNQQDELSGFLIERANAYKQAICGSKWRISSWIKFPPHQLGYKWSRDICGQFSKFEEIRVYHHQVRYSADGVEILEHSKQLKSSFTKSI